MRSKIAATLAGLALVLGIQVSVATPAHALGGQLHNTGAGAGGPIAITCRWGWVNGTMTAVPGYIHTMWPGQSSSQFCGGDTDGFYVPSGYNIARGYHASWGWQATGTWDATGWRKIVDWDSYYIWRVPQ